MRNRPSGAPVDTGPADVLPDIGLYVDDERSIAAVSHPSRANPSLHIASLHRTVLYVHGDGSASLGGTDDDFAAEFTHYVDTEVRSNFEPGDLVAMTLRCLLVEVATSIGTDPALFAAAATFPARWTAEQVSDLRQAMNRHGLNNVALVSESEALTAWSESTQATWAGSDSGIAAARGAAAIAAHYPVDAVTEEIAVLSPARPLWTRTPVLAAVAFAALLALGGSVTALVLQDSSNPGVPEIESAPVIERSTPASATAGNIPFPTVVPIIEPIATPVPTTEFVVPEPAPETPAPSSEVTRDPLPQTRPAAEETETPTSEPEVADEEPSVTPEEEIEPVPDESNDEDEPEDTSDSSDDVVVGG